MGFYAPAQLVRDARDHGVEIRPVCVNRSEWDCTLEGGAIRLGLRMASGLDEAHARLLMARRVAPFATPAALHRITGLPAAAMVRLAEADGFAGMGLDRRAALWAIRALEDEPLPLFATPVADAAVALPEMPEGGQVVQDYRSVGLSLRRHPVAFLRAELAGQGMLPCTGLGKLRNGRRATVGGLVLVRQKPGSAKGVMFITLEDESGVANIIVWPKLFEAERRLILSARMLAVRGQVQQENGVLHLIAEGLFDLTPLLDSVGARGEAFRLPHTRGDEARSGGAPDQRTAARAHPRAARPFGIRVPTRDFR